MINKPINPSPFNTCVDMSKNWKISCEIPNDTIDQAYVSVNKLDTGEQIYGEYKTFDTPSNKIEVEMSDSFAEYNDGEYSWNTFYWKNSLIDGDEYEFANSNSIDDISLNLPNAEFLGTSFRIYTEQMEVWNDFKTYPEYVDYPMIQVPDGVLDIIEKGKYDDLFLRIQLPDIFGIGKQITICSVKCLACFCADMIGSRVGLIIDRNIHDFLKKYFYNQSGGIVINGYQLTLNNSTYFPTVKIYKFPTTNSGIQTGNYIKYNNNLHYINKVNEDYTIKISTIPKINRSITTPSNENDVKLFETIDSVLNSMDASVSDVKQIKNCAEMVKSSLTLMVNTQDINNINSSPNYYFRAKTPPTIGIYTYNQFSEETETIDDTNEITSYKLSDFKASFSIKYSSDVKYNYGYFYLSVFNPETYNWEIVERSQMMLSADIQNSNNMYTYDGFANGQKYKIYGVYTDIDGDEWTTDEFEFTVDIPIITTHTDKFEAKFNPVKTTIDISFNGLMDMYKNFSIKFYKVKKNDVYSCVPFQYAGGGLCKTGGEQSSENIVQDGNIISFNKWYDYNIQNDAYYDYYARVEYHGVNYTLDSEDVSSNEEYNVTSSNWKVDIFLIASDIYTDFKGTSILSLEKINDMQFNVVYNFNLFYHFDENNIELTSEINREYINTFSKYPKELKGYQNNISSRCTGLLGDEIKGLYVEPKGIRDKWINFIDDDTIKFYRGYDGQTMIISINSSSVKPRNYSDCGIVNEVDISFKEIASTTRYAVFGTERTGD